MNTNTLLKGLLILFVSLIVSCNNKKDKANDLPVIDIVQNLGKYQPVPVSQFVTELEYIPLETNDSCLTGIPFAPIVTSTHIFIWENKYCYAFSRDGRFLCKIGSVGQGPGEYSNLSKVFVDEKSQSLYLQTLRTLLEYSWDGVFRQSISLPKNILGNSPTNVAFVHDNLFIGYFTSVPLKLGRY